MNEEKKYIRSRFLYKQIEHDWNNRPSKFWTRQGIYSIIIENETISIPSRVFFRDIIPFDKISVKYSTNFKVFQGFTVISFKWINSKGSEEIVHFFGYRSKGIEKIINALNSKVDVSKWD